MKGIVLETVGTDLGKQIGESMIIR